jgi:hypothetical protein
MPPLLLLEYALTEIMTIFISHESNIEDDTTN